MTQGTHYCVQLFGEHTKHCVCYAIGTQCLRYLCALLQAIQGTQCRDYLCALLCTILSTPSTTGLALPRCPLFSSLHHAASATSCTSEPPFLNNQLWPFLSLNRNDPSSMKSTIPQVTILLFHHDDLWRLNGESLWEPLHLIFNNDCCMFGFYPILSQFPASFPASFQPSGKL